MPRKQAQRVVPEMLEAFERGLTEQVLERLLSFAKRRVAMLAKAGLRQTQDDARSMVQDAITDTLTRVVTWEPERVGLETHLRLVIRTRSLNRLTQARRTPHKSMEDSVDGELTTAAASAVASTLPQDALAVGEVATQVMASVRARAAGDRSVLALLDAYGDGCHERAEVLELTGMSVSEFVNARRRLDRMLAGLSEEMQDNVRDTLGRNV
jgi:DNA-directed RNA polymerase specialized sigma24 family protein